jgi:hypothetical protein
VRPERPGSRESSHVTGERGTATFTLEDALVTTMADRIMKVNAYTTLDLLDGEIEGHGFTEEAPAVLNVTSPRREPDHVSLQLELDNADIEAVRPHADTVRLSPAEARELAADLEKHADTVEAADAAE